MAGKGLEGREAGRQVSRMQSGEIGERVAGKKKKKKNSAKFYPVTSIRKIHLDMLKTKPKRKTEKAQDVKYTYISRVGIYV